MATAPGLAHGAGRFGQAPQARRGSERLTRRRWRGPGGLTRRELEVLALVATGLTNNAVARRLWVTDETVKFHLSNIYRKLGVPNREAATVWASQSGVANPAETEHDSLTTT